MGYTAPTPVVGIPLRTLSIHVKPHFKWSNPEGCGQNGVVSNDKKTVQSY